MAPEPEKKLGENAARLILAALRTITDKSGDNPSRQQQDQWLLEIEKLRVDLSGCPQVIGLLLDHVSDYRYIMRVHEDKSVGSLIEHLMAELDRIFPAKK